jgi:glutamate dehydrogenase
MVSRQERLDEVARLARTGAGPDEQALGDEAMAAWVAAYFDHADSADLADAPAPALAGMLRRHLALGRRRAKGERLLAISPRPAELDAAGSTLVQLVTDDHPFLVDSVVMELRRQEWTLRRLLHPQVRARRDAAGVLQGAGAGTDGLAESWISLEVYPPLGRSAEEAGPALEAGLAESLAQVAVAVADWQPMVAHALASARSLAAGAPGPGDDTPDPSATERRDAVELLTWLAHGHFVFLGYREYSVADGVFTPLAGTGLGILRGTARDEFHAVQLPGQDELLVFTRDPRHSRVHRRAYLDYLGVRRYDADGRLVGERRFLGLLASSVYTESVAHIPVLAAKAERLGARSGWEPGSYGNNAVQQAIAAYPRDELFEAGVDELAPIVLSLAALRGRRVVRAFVRLDRYGQFATVLVHLPQDRYSTRVRLRIADVLMDELGGDSLEYTSLTESGLTRLYFVIRRSATSPAEVDLARIQSRVGRATRTWADDFTDLVDHQPSETRGVEFSEAYEEAYPPQVAVADLAAANELAGPDDLAFRLHLPPPGETAGIRFKVFGRQGLELARVIPHLSALGVDVVDERPFEWELRGERVLVYDFGLRPVPGAPAAADWDADTRQRFVAAFEASWRGRCEPGRFNQLVLTAGLQWREVAWLRGISRYLLQAGVGFSQQYIAACLHANTTIAAGLVRAFRAKFDPDAEPDGRAAALARELDGLATALDAVGSLDHDRILRMFLAVIDAMVRTNAFTDPEALAYKLEPTRLALLPQPRPAFEVFVYSPRVQGVHLRFGRVARGGLRWSDRKEDFRTEVLGLVKAQTVKNTVIVPTGAKGGFVPQHLPDPAADRAGWLAEGRACYRIFVDALLSLTDNLAGDAVVPPDRVVRHDGDDPYLVVAADKGTATLSDLANSVSAERGFWLGDAFASGGSAGYDHKRMGITARGTWESVKQHFRELGVDCQTTDFTCVGIGDLSGDVFGNGMLASEHLRLVAAFNHQHIFLDPDPDAAVSFAERLRVFGLPRSTWADYDPSLISPGGGVYPRYRKSVPVSPQVAAALGIPAGTTSLTPPELIRAILTAPVDLLFNGGIGTYVKASSETNADAADRANDAVRVDGRDVRARCAAEGGNLGWTQLGRVEYARAGGLVNTDFIDNSAGVDTSDHEVNIKILLADAGAAGLLEPSERDPLLASMTDEVARHVLGHNADQNIALVNGVSRATTLAGQHEAWMRTLVAEGLLDRALEFLPDSAEMERRIAAGDGLSRPELAVLFAYTKIALKRWMLATDLPEDAYLADRLVGYFPHQLRERFAAVMPRHALAREIITTVAVNRFVNSQGSTAFHRLSTETGAGVADVIRAQLAARSIYGVGLSEVLLGRMTGLDAGLTTALRMELRRMVERATRWLLHNRRPPLDIRATIEEFADPVGVIRAGLADRVTPAQRLVADRLYEGWVGRGAPVELAASMATATHAHYALGIADIARRLGREPLVVADAFFGLGAALGLDTLVDRIDVLPRQVRWDAMARAALRDELLEVHAELTAAVLAADPGLGAAEAVAAWLADNPEAGRRAATLAEVCGAEPDLARMSVGLGLVRALLR